VTGEAGLLPGKGPAGQQDSTGTGLGGCTGASRQVRRVVLLAGRAEAARLCRNPLVLAGLVIAAALIWWNSRTVVPRWWVWDVQIGSALLCIAAATLVAAQLAAGRVRRDGTEHLYESYPASASARTTAHLLGLAAPLLLAAVLAGAAVIWLDLLGAVGSPRLAVLTQGLLLVALGGATGLALGTWLPNPMTGILTALVLGAAEADLLLPPYDVPAHLSHGTIWLFPWTQPAVDGQLPGPTPGLPPASHLAWLAALTCLAAVVALWRVVPRRRTAIVALAAAACLAVTGWSGWAQTRPVPLSVLDSLLYLQAHPAQSERCVLRQRVRYCAYPQFGADVARWASVVDGVLGAPPDRPTATLVIYQLMDTALQPPDVGYLPPAAARNAQFRNLRNESARFQQAEGSDPGLVPGSSTPPVFVDLDWGRGSALGPYQLGLALQVAWWLAGLPTTARNVDYSSGPNTGGVAQISCLPVGQAREAIALWLAASATPAARTAFLDGPANYIQPVNPAGPGYLIPEKVGGRWITAYQPAIAGYAPALIYTGQGAALAEAMLRLPTPRVEAVLAARWHGWLSPRATDGQLAAALGVPLPAVPPPSPSMVNQGQPADPVCT
jgi:hypothetical protein